jgi:hypothetical protein
MMGEAVLSKVGLSVPSDALLLNLWLPSSTSYDLDALYVVNVVAQRHHRLVNLARISMI